LIEQPAQVIAFHFRTGLFRGPVPEQIQQFPGPLARVFRITQTFLVGSERAVVASLPSKGIL
jgi:hypothetical protein